MFLADGWFDKLQPHLPTLLMLVGIALLTYFVMRANSAMRRGNNDSDKDVRQTRALIGERDRDSALADAPAEILRWQVEMHATARDLKGELDSKILVLQALLKEVREERQKVEELLARRK